MSNGAALGFVQLEVAWPGRIDVEESGHQATRLKESRLRT
jgi:hypothetical protein